MYRDGCAADTRCKIEPDDSNRGLGEDLSAVKLPLALPHTISGHASCPIAVQPTQPVYHHLTLKIECFSSRCRASTRTRPPAFITLAFWPLLAKKQIRKDDVCILQKPFDQNDPQMQLRKREKGGCENKTFEMTHGESIGAAVVGSSRTPNTCTICVIKKRLKHEKLQK